MLGLKAAKGKRCGDVWSYFLSDYVREELFMMEALKNCLIAHVTLL